MRSSVAIEPHLARIIALRNQGLAPAALQLAQQLLAQAPQHPALHQMLATLLFEQGDVATAGVHITTSLAQRPDHVPSLTLAAKLAHSNGALPTALQHLRAAIKQTPDDAPLRCLLAVWQLQAHQAQAAVQTLEDLTQRWPQHVQAWYELGRACHALRDLARSRDALKQALALQADLVPAWFVLALVQQDLGDLPAAQATLERLLVLQPQHAQALVNLGIVLQLQAQLDSAMHRYAQAYALQADCFGRIANALCAERHGQLWLDLDALRQALHEIVRPNPSAAQPPTPLPTTLP